MLIVTRNQHKFEEFKRLAPQVSWQTLGQWERLQEELAPLEIFEDADTFAGNAVLKSLAGFELTGEVTIADDSGLCVHALQGRPGIHSARYVEGTDRDRYLALLEELKDVPPEQRTAFFHCALAISGLKAHQLSALEAQALTQAQAQDGHPAGQMDVHTRFETRYSLIDQTFVVEERCYGRIALRASGEAGFGYDPIFELADGRSFASISGYEKDQISHRGRALRALMKIWENI